MHGKAHGLGLAQQGKIPEFDLERRIQRWEKKARERRELIGVPSGHIHDPGALDQEKAFKALAANRAIQLLNKPNMRVLDIGCGSGLFALHFIPTLLQRGGSYVGIDQCQWTIDFAWQYLEKNGIKIDGKSVHLTEGLATRLTWGRKRFFQREFDLIVDGQNMIHVVDNQEFQLIVDQHCEVLKPGGYVFWYGPCCDLNFRYRDDGARKN
jgi:2-polyprenyl-3-methyl-5-hydroxy-6-metoxy-1,4-benzoquinol methylase